MRRLICTVASALTLCALVCYSSLACPYERLTDHQLAHVLGAGQGGQRRTDEKGNVLYTNCYEANRQGTSGKASCRPPTPGGSDCISCDDGSGADVPSVDYTKQVTPGYHETVQLNCGGLLWTGSCQQDNTCSRVVNTGLSCATHIKDSVAQTKPVDP